MKIFIPTIGTRGDAQPYISLASGLQQAGAQVTLATHPAMRTLVESYGVNFEPAGPDIDIGKETAAILASSPNWKLGFMQVMRFTFRMLEQAHPDLLALCWGADLVIVSHTAAGSIEADELQLPTVSVTLFPQAIPVDEPFQPFFRRAIGAMAGAGMGLVMTLRSTRSARGPACPQWAGKGSPRKSVQGRRSRPPSAVLPARPGASSSCPSARPCQS
jgi:hypothetical protein